MRNRLVLAFTGALTAALFLVMAAPATPGAAHGTRAIPSGGTTSIQPGATGADAVQSPEFDPGIAEDDEGGGVQVNRPRPGFKNGKFPKNPLDAPTVASSAVAGSNPEVAFGLQGLNHRDQRLANGGNQFSLEPPDQGLCVGNGFTVEVVNSVIRVYSSSTGTALTGVQDLNTFFGYPAAINRTTGAIRARRDRSDLSLRPGAPPVRRRDHDAVPRRHDERVQRQEHRSTLPSSNTGDPTGLWTIYHVPAQNDGTDGTPNHGCTLDGSTPGPCFQDYPHIGADANGLYITTNEYDLFGPSFNAAQIFAFSNTQLAAHPASIAVTLVENLNVDGSPGFTVWPATSNAGDYATDKNGTEYFLSTIAGDGSETGNPTGTARRIGLWALTNTASLNTSTSEPADHEPADQQRDVRVPAEVRPEGREHSSRGVH